VNQETMIGLAEAAAKLGVPYQDAHRLLLTGRLTGEKRGGRWYVRLVDVERILRERNQPAPAA
jgi:hypothetical protein